MYGKQDMKWVNTTNYDRKQNIKEEKCTKEHILGLLLKIVFDILVINGKTVNPPIQIFHLESILAKIFFYGEGVVG